MGIKNDYRISTIVVLCKDCNEDVGLYPARHQCSNTKKPKLPTLYSSTSNTSWIQSPSQSPTSLEPLNSSYDRLNPRTEIPRMNSWSQSTSSQTELPTLSTTNTSQTESPINTPWSESEQEEEEEEEDVYLNHYLSNTDTNNANGKQLWGKIKENEKWKDLINKEKEKEKTSYKLWEKMINITMQEQVSNQDPESDDDDWKGETHVSRILREYYESNNTSLPEWLLDDRTPLKSLAKVDPTTMITNRPCKLWQQQQQPAMSRSQSERKPMNNTQQYLYARNRTNTIKVNRERYDRTVFRA